VSVKLVDEPCVLPKWSPKGTWLAATGSSRTLILQPGRGLLRRIDGKSSMFWLDDRRVVTWEHPSRRWYLTEVTGGEEDLYYDPRAEGRPSFFNCHDVYYDPHFSGCHVAAEPDGDSSATRDIFLFGKDLVQGRTIWQDPSNNVQDEAPKISPCGEYVAWTRGLSAGPGDPGWAVALKKLRAPAAARPTMLHHGVDVHFCDWTPDSQLLVARRDGDMWALEIWDRDGEIVNRVDTPFRVGSPTASFRKRRGF
jgi:hypothetical protein